jgi:hypothetical protein
MLAVLVEKHCHDNALAVAISMAEETDRLADRLAMDPGLHSELVEPLVTSLDKFGAFARASLARRAEVDDVLWALDPLPESFLTFQHRGGDDYRSSVSNPLKWLDSSGRRPPKSGWGDLGLNMTTVLSGASQEQGSHGLRPGEGRVQRAYAEDNGFEYHAWPEWLAAAL